jgi:hypothetical protein
MIMKNFHKSYFFLSNAKQHTKFPFVFSRLLIFFKISDCQNSCHNLEKNLAEKDFYVGVINYLLLFFFLHFVVV